MGEYALLLRRLSRFGVVPAVVAVLPLLLLCGCGEAVPLLPAGVTPKASLSGGTATIVWNIPPGKLPPSVIAGLASATATDVAAGGYRNRLSIDSAVMDAGWALLGVADITPSGAEKTPTGVYVLLAYQSRDGWHVAGPNDSDFCSVAARAPTSILDQEARDYLLGCPEVQR